MIIKVCGMRDVENIRAVSALGIDMMGMIFWEGSPRCIKCVPPLSGVPRVGVFVDALPQDVITCAYNYQLDYIQLHGKEGRVYMENLRHTLDPDIRLGIRLIKAVSIETADDILKCKECEGVADMLLFDTKTPKAGGSGRKFDWSLLGQYQGKTPFLLSGGIGPDDAEEIRKFRHPCFAGIDLNSRFEKEPGVKDVELLATFIKGVRNEQD